MTGTHRHTQTRIVIIIDVHDQPVHTILDHGPPSPPTNSPSNCGTTASSLTSPASPSTTTPPSTLDHAHRQPPTQCTPKEARPCSNSAAANTWPGLKSTGNPLTSQPRSLARRHRSPPSIGTPDTTTSGPRRGGQQRQQGHPSHPGNRSAPDAPATADRHQDDPRIDGLRALARRCHRLPGCIRPPRGFAGAFRRSESPAFKSNTSASTATMESTYISSVPRQTRRGTERSHRSRSAATPNMRVCAWVRWMRLVEASLRGARRP